MAEHFINLNCTNCGAKLDVYDDMERFCCGYCGTELVAQRRGGTVALRTVTGAIKKVQIGTDKTAAELALARLGQESVRLDEELKRLAAEANGLKRSPLASKGCAVLFAATAGLFGGGLFVSGFQGRSGFSILLGLVMIGGSLAWLINAWSASTSDKLTMVEKQISEKQAEVAEVKSRVVEQRRIVDSI